MKRAAIWTILVVAAMALTACGGATPTPEAVESPAETDAPVVETEAPAEPVHIAFFVPWTEDVWYVAAIAGAQARAEALGVQLDVYDAGYQVETQIQQFDTALASAPDAIVLSSVDPAAMVPSVESAHEAGIVVVDYDRPLWTTTALDALLILDTPGIGTQGANAIVEYLTAKYGEPRGTVIRAFGDLADTWVTDISSGWDPVMAEYPDITVLEATSGPWEPEQAAANVEQLLVTHPEVDAIFLDSDWLGSGITAYLESGGYGRVGEDNHIYYVGVGGMPQALDYIREGWMDLTINNPVPDFAGAAVEVAYTLVTGQSLGAEWSQEGAPWSPAAIAVAVPTDDKPYAGPVLNMQNFIVDTSNVDDPMLWGNIVAEQ